MITDYSVSTVLFAFALTVFAGLATGIGGLIAIAKKNPGPHFLAGTMGLSAGVMLYVSFIELLPESIESLTSHSHDHAGHADHAAHTASWIAVSVFFLSMAAIALIDRLIPEPMHVSEHDMSDKAARQHQQAMMKTGSMAALALMIHNFPEGAASFVAGTAQASIALPVVCAIAIHNIPEGIAVGVPIREATSSKKKALLWTLISGLTEPLGALVCLLFLMPFMNGMALGIIFACVAGVMVFISLDKLLPAALSTNKQHTAIYGVILGMAIMALSLLLFHHTHAV
ncbi:zinc transporter ZupT [Corynebacterium sp. sy039]|uniref:zinc transporter ZupT n=1 Tax=Corynebacterium sp. sy039 TaxID=2599641 RepID=UPI0011B5883D|nr:zinc transporter ZupT [Corynebacterium sp. sy039]QDZ42989.1 zinc transporter ZupT [Corynebacterium sp. sy039]